MCHCGLKLNEEGTCEFCIIEDCEICNPEIQEDRIKYEQIQICCDS